MHAVQSAFLDSLRYLNLLFQNRNIYKVDDVMAHLNLFWSEEVSV